MGRVSVEKFSLSAVKAFAFTDVGQQRKDNQDSYGIIERDNFRFYMVADGMGGINGGGVASHTAVIEITNVLGQHNKLSALVMSEAIISAHERIKVLAESRKELEGMGTTMSGIGFGDKSTLICNVGDSRVYRKRGALFSQLTQDHTYGAELVMNGAFPRGQAFSGPMASMLTRALGVGDSVKPDIQFLHQSPEFGDRYLICSDGVHGMMSQDKIESLMFAGADTRTLTMNLVTEANRMGGMDNITVIVVDILSVGSTC
jgi:protein phosphatase